MSYFAAAVVRGADGWTASELDLTGVADVEEVADRLRDVDPDADLSLLFVESDDAYLVILRLDEGEDLRVFGSDSVFAEESRLGALLLGDIEAPALEIDEAGRAAGGRGGATTRPSQPAADPDADPVGDADLLADLGVSVAPAARAVRARGHAAGRRHRRGLPGDRLRRRGRGAARGVTVPTGRPPGAPRGSGCAAPWRVARPDVAVAPGPGGRAGRRGRATAPDGAELAAGRNERELTGDPTAHAEIVALRRAAAALGTLAAGRLHARGDAGAVHDVRRRAGAGPDRHGRLRRLGAEDRCGRLAVGRGARPPAQPPPRGLRRGARGRVRRPAARLLPASGRAQQTSATSRAAAGPRRSGRSVAGSSRTITRRPSA